MKVFQSKSGKLVELKEKWEKGKNFDLEKSIQSLIEHNLNVVFNDLEFLETEYVIEGFRIDTVAFDVERNSFVIIEYKNILNKSLIDQGVTYYQLLQEHQADFVLLYSKKKITGKIYQKEDFNWDEVRVIFISPIFDKFQKKASGFQSLPIELYEIRNFDSEIMTFTKIETKSSEPMKTELKTRTHSKIIQLEYNEENYLAGKYDTQIPTSRTRELYFNIKNAILDRFENIECKQKKKYVGFYSKENGSAICTIEVTKNKLKLVYSTTKKDLLPKSDFVEDVSNKGHWGIGHFRSEIAKESDIENALPIIQKVYEDKVKS